MKQTGTCVKSAAGATLSAVSWIDGKEVFVRLTIAEQNGTSKSITLSGGTGLVFAHDLKEIVPAAEVVG